MKRKNLHLPVALRLFQYGAQGLVPFLHLGLHKELLPGIPNLLLVNVGAQDGPLVLGCADLHRIQIEVEHLRVAAGFQVLAAFLVCRVYVLE